MQIFIIIAQIGLILSLITHLCALIDLQNPLGEFVWILHWGIFIVWIPAVILSKRLTRNFPQKDFWKAALQGCPVWIKKMTYFFFGYAIFNFIIFAVFDSNNSNILKAKDTPSNVLRGFSGHWMAFYSVALAIFYSNKQAKEKDSNPRCINGHTVPSLVKFCPVCGNEIRKSETYNN